ncbi:MAG: hypothetical protein IPM71_07060 [Bacteroidota bacterium]|nr:MAG: hypothetical protein IPM71_07060 [Bacteroidota bacterium]
MPKYFIVLAIFFLPMLQAQQMPLGYTRYFDVKTSGSKLNDQLISGTNTSITYTGSLLKIQELPDSSTGVFPFSLAWLDNHIFGDFIALLRLQAKTVETDSMSDIYLVAGLRDSSNYYFIRLNQNGAGFFKMYKGQVSSIALDTTFKPLWQNWQDMRLTRDILTRSLTIECKGFRTQFSDPNLVMGYIGIGVDGCILQTQQFEVWAPTSIQAPFKQ